MRRAGTPFVLVVGQLALRYLGNYRRYRYYRYLSYRSTGNQLIAASKGSSRITRRAYHIPTQTYQTEYDIKS